VEVKFCWERNWASGGGGLDCKMNDQMIVFGIIHLAKFFDQSEKFIAVFSVR
jgi:hypothetical protein